MTAQLCVDTQNTLKDKFLVITGYGHHGYH